MRLQGTACTGGLDIPVWQHRQECLSHFVRRSCCLVGFLAASLVLTSCGDNKMAVVKGTVTFDSKPIENGWVNFYPVDGKSATSGIPIKDGRFTGSVPIGLMKVHIVGVPKLAGMKRPYPDSPEKPYYTESIPKKYSDREETELELDVKPGVNEKNWTLKSD
jgi:hypothetical protein